MPATYRLNTVRARANQVLDWLEEEGPAVVSAIQSGTRIEAQNLRYALRVLLDEERVHIQSYERLISADGRARFTATYAAGKGKNASMNDDDSALAGVDTSHLQAFVSGWPSMAAP